MIRQEIVGHYLGREVYIAGSSDLFQDLPPESLRHAVILIWLPKNESFAELRPHLHELVTAAPLVVSLAGPGAEGVFDTLMQLLDTEEPASPILTRWNEDSFIDCLEDLWQGTWPSEDRFDDWTHYLMIATGGATNFVSKAAAESLQVEAPEP